MTKQELESLVVRVLAEMGLKGKVRTTVEIDAGVLCSVVSLPNGARQVFMDSSLDRDATRAVEEIKLQLQDMI